MLAPNPAIEPAPAPTLHDVTIVRKKKSACARVEGVPPEEFGIARNARSIKDGYHYHEVAKKESELIADGYDPDQIRALPSFVSSDSTEAKARDTVDETNITSGDDGVNRAARLIKITEHYTTMDYEGTGKPCLYRVTTGGDDGEILRRKQKQGDKEVYKDEIVREYQPCFAAMTPVIVTHRFFGRSIADLVMDIQRIKTALVRGLLDNTYLSLNPRTEVSESHANESTLDDLLISRPGGVVRTRQPGGLNVLQHPDISASIYPGLQYFDATREWRTGVSRQGQGLDANALQNQTATAANQLFTAAQARIKLVARIFAETGIRDLFSLLHTVIRKNGSVAQTVRLRNEWVTVDPRQWKSRNDMTINVGLGTGGKEQQLAFLNMLIGAQEKALAAGMVSKSNLYNSAKELVKLMGRKDPEAFFTPPPEQEAAAPIEPPQDPKLIEIDKKAEIEKLQAEADIATNNQKMANEAAMQERKFQFETSLEEKRFTLERELKLLDAQIKIEQSTRDAAMKDEQHRQSLEQNNAKHQASMEAEQVKQAPAKDMNKTIGDVGGAVQKLAERMDEMERQAMLPLDLIHDPKTKKVAKVRRGNREIAINRI